MRIDPLLKEKMREPLSSVSPVTAIGLRTKSVAAVRSVGAGRLVYLS